jgi:catechol 2,3-dioxygenase-like lactoylglutathione lyase family enzyme
MNLDNLRKQAKQYVRWHRERHGTVAEVIRNALPRYAELSDSQIFKEEFRLADAQELVARREGFQDWESLVAAARDPAVPADGPTPGAGESPRVLVARPFVFVRDVRAACAYYVDALGFTLAFDYGSPPFYAEVERDGVRLCVRHTDGPIVDQARAKREDVILASFEVTDAKALYLELQSTGAVFAQTLRTEPYGIRGFITEDPDGNRIEFFDAYGVKGAHRLQEVPGRILGPS